MKCLTCKAVFHLRGTVSFCPYCGKSYLEEDKRDVEDKDVLELANKIRDIWREFDER